MLPRFFSASRIHGDHVELLGDEAHHLIDVLRGTIGQSVTLFDGTGDEFRATIRNIGKRQVVLSVDQRVPEREDQRKSRRLTVAVSFPKGDRQRLIVEKLTELGTRLVVPLMTTRSVAQPTPGAVERWKRYVIEACKQSGRNRLMEFSAPVDIKSFLTRSFDPSTLRILCHPASQFEIGGSSIDWRDLPNTIIACIGPEGGFSEEEIRLADERGWTIARLGGNTLRVETAAIAVASLVLLVDS